MDTVNSQATITFAQLPLEVFTRITRHLPTTSLCQVRLTCKIVENKVLGAFAHEFFRKKQFMVTTPSLSALVEIAKHPTFGPVLQHVIIATDRHDTARWYEKATPWTNAEWAVWKDATGDQDSLINTGIWREYLEEALVALPNLRTIDIRDFNSTTRFRDGQSTEWHSFGAMTIRDKTGLLFGMYGRSEKWLDTLFQVTLLAIAKTGVCPPNLEVIPRHASLSDNAFYLTPRFKASLEPHLAFLTKLHLAVSVPNTHIDHNIPNLQRFLNATPNLRSLRLNLPSTRDSAVGPFLAWLAQPSQPASTTGGTDMPSPALAHLEDLSLGFFTADLSVIEELLTKFAPTLRKASLWRVTLSHPDDNANVWELLVAGRSGTPLRELGMGELSQCSPHFDYAVKVKFASGTARKTIRAYHGEDPWVKASKDLVVEKPPPPAPSWHSGDDDEGSDEEDELDGNHNDDNHNDDDSDDDDGEDEDDDEDEDENGDGN